MLLTKYGVNLKNLPYELPTIYVSYLWKPIGKIWHAVKRGIQWNVGNGKTIRFWWDCWVTKNQPLINYEIAPVLDHLVHRKVVDFVDNVGNWLWESFIFLLPYNILLRITSYKPPLADDGAYQVFWVKSAKGCFIVKSAYHALSKTILSDKEKLWSLARSWKGP